MYNEFDNNTFSAPGKLLLTAEYLVLHGAEALAIPLKFGQTLKIEPSFNKALLWRAYTPNGLWFETEFDARLKIVRTSDQSMGAKLQDILQKALNMGGLHSERVAGHIATTTLQFLPEWGFGSSSTMISLISQWLKINPYRLLEATFGGSGYDVAVATIKKPLIYERSTDFKPIISQLNFNPPFADNLLFFYLGNKQISSSEVVKYQQVKPKESLISEINSITQKFTECNILSEFQEYMIMHEKIIGYYIDKPSINQTLNIPTATLKSLGAWGGDFALAATNNIQQTKQILYDRGYTVQFNYNELIY